MEVYETAAEDTREDWTSIGIGGFCLFCVAVLPLITRGIVHSRGQDFTAMRVLYNSQYQYGVGLHSWENRLVRAGKILRLEKLSDST